jgi:hypothetical protein
MKLEERNRLTTQGQIKLSSASKLRGIRACACLYMCLGYASGARREEGDCCVCTYAESLLVLIRGGEATISSLHDSERCCVAWSVMEWDGVGEVSFTRSTVAFRLSCECQLLQLTSRQVSKKEWMLSKG